ncbi:MAG TPA: chalcone isomerase family protein [Desulfobacterales bacterium]|nr:chalcone isomerase family protein [Desulfobacterales bacterium]
MTESGINQTGTRPIALSATLVGVIVFSILSGVSAAPQAATVEGVTFSREVRAGDSDLSLRGYGLLRYMVFIKAYVAAFYLPERIRSEDALGDVPKHLEIEYFHPITAEDFAKATSSSISRNVSLMTFQRLKPKIDEFNALYRDVKPGDRYALTYIPGKGTTLSWNGQPLGTVAGEDFAVGLFDIWLGPNPLDSDLKRLLLGE